jgi:pimeloyl-ACP methyl ester carboxylesterase
VPAGSFLTTRRDAREGMRAFLQLLLHDSTRTEDDDYVRRWHTASLVPGAFEVMASARLSPPGIQPASPFGRPDRTPYERIAVPTLVAGGAEDTMRLEGWMEEFVPRLPAGRSLEYPRCGHLVPIDAGEAFAADALAFLLEVYPPSDSSDATGATRATGATG